MNEYRINQSINQTIHKHTLIAKEQKQVSHRGWRAKHFKGLLTIQKVPPACRTPPGTVRCNAKVILGMAINRTRIRLCGSSILLSHAIDSHRVYSFETQTIHESTAQLFYDLMRLILTEYIHLRRKKRADRTGLIFLKNLEFHE